MGVAVEVDQVRPDPLRQVQQPVAGLGEVAPGSSIHSSRKSP